MATGGRTTFRPRQPSKLPLGCTRTDKFCRFCKEGGKSKATFSSHDSVHCDSLSKSELRTMLTALRAMDLTLNNQDLGDNAAAEGLGYGFGFRDQGDQSQGLEPAGSS